MASYYLVMSDMVKDIYKFSIEYSHERLKSNKKLNRNKPANTPFDHTIHAHDRPPITPLSAIHAPPVQQHSPQTCVH